MRHELSSATLLAAMAMMACESQPETPQNGSSLGPGDLRHTTVVTPGGQELVGTSAQLHISPTLEDTSRNVVSFGVQAKELGAAQPTFHFAVGLEVLVNTMTAGNAIEVPIRWQPSSIPGVPLGPLPTGTARVTSEQGGFESGLVYVKLETGKFTGWADTPAGRYQFTGRLEVQCLKVGQPGGTGDNGSPNALLEDKAFETPLCQPFAGLRTPTP